jgi:hypothetical protein
MDNVSARAADDVLDRVEIVCADLQAACRAGSVDVPGPARVDRRTKPDRNRRGDLRQIIGVRAGTAVVEVVTVVGRREERVVAVAAFGPVIAGSANEDVVAVAAPKCVVAVLTVEPVRAGVAGKAVGGTLSRSAPRARWTFTPVELPA